jgi:thiol-disulfide isomerase/thioredoxin
MIRMLTLLILMPFVFRLVAITAEPPEEKKPADNSSLPAFGKPAPQFHLEKLLQAPANAPLTLDKLRGKAVILEFWGTWCGPCIVAFPHLNELVREIRGEPVVFIAVANEPADDVAAFLKKKPLAAWVGIDDQGATTKGYGIRSFPTAVLIDPDGVVQGVTDVTSVTPAMVKDLANRRPLQASGDAIPRLRTDAKGGIDLGEANFLIYLGPPNDLLGDPVSGANEWKSRSCPAQGLLESCYVREAGGWPKAPRIVFECAIPQKDFGFAVRVPEGSGLSAITLLKQAVESALGFRTRGDHESREQQVLVLKHVGPASPAKPAGNRALGSVVRFPANACIGESASLDDLSAWIEGRTKKPVINETGLGGEHDWKIKAESFALDDLNTALKSIGLVLRPEQRKVDYIVVRRVDVSKKVTGTSQRSNIDPEL